jgi:putative ABC transport system substrate-binding protein
MREATQTIPVVFALVGDPVGNGFVANPARPGGNATGFQNFEPAAAEKWLTLLQEIAPGLRRACIVYNRRVIGKLARNFLAEVQLAAITILLN